jgi:hypothetical protein
VCVIVNHLSSNGHVTQGDHGHAIGIAAWKWRVLFHPDYTVGPGIAPDLHPFSRKALAGSRALPHTAGGEFRPALRTGRK